jgi:hypothetical protein
VRRVLDESGFEAVALDEVLEPMWFGTDAEDAFAFTADAFGWMVQDLDEDAKTNALSELRALLAAHETDNGVNLDSGGWLIAARRR